MTISDTSPLGAGRAASSNSVSRLYEQALTLAAMGFHEDATVLLRDVTARAPGHAPAWQKLAQLLRLEGKDKDARVAAARAATNSAEWLPTIDGRSAVEIDAAERELRERLTNSSANSDPLKALRARLRMDEADVVAMRLLGRLEWKSGELATARALFERALALAPGYEGARADLVLMLQVLAENSRAVEEAGRLAAAAPENITYQALLADALLALGDFESAIPLLEHLIQKDPASARFRCIYAQALNFAGRRDESIREFRACLALQPGMGEAYWGLAELRGNLLTAADISDMRAYLRDSDRDASSRLRLQYALGEALEQARDFTASFEAYEAGATLLRTIAASTGETYNTAKDAEQVRRRRAVFTPSFLDRRKAQDNDAAFTPIFVVGMPRAGSTLVEQILASHSQVEATMELPVLGNIARDLSQSRPLVTPDAYPECLADMSGVELTELGARYLEDSAPFRKTNLRYFVDKRPWNWLEAGLIDAILPRARIVDIRREPMAACFSMYKHLLAEDATFPYEFGDLARCYMHYVRMMNHYKSVMPGRIHFLSYERLVEDTETEIRGLLDYCGLPFEENCLRFWLTRRVVSTPSAEQVRRPIFREGLEQWRNFEPWLGPLKEALKAAEAEAAAESQPDGYEYALTLSAMGMYELAVEALRAVVDLAPSHPGAWRKLSELLRLSGEDEEADKAQAFAHGCAQESAKWQPSRDPRTPAQMEAAERRLHARSPGADSEGLMEILRRHLLENPTDAAAAHALSRLEGRVGDELTAMALLERTLELAPLFHAARAELAYLLMRRTSFVRALEQTTILIERAPRSEEYSAIHSDALQCVGDFTGALEVTEGLLREHPRHPRFWYGYGLLLHYLGRREESARAFRTALDIMPAMGEAWWGLADLKGSFAAEGDATAIRACLDDPRLEPASRMYMNYALGAILERAGDFSSSFIAYQKGARLFRGAFLSRGEAYSEDDLVERIDDLKRVFGARTLAMRAPQPPVAPQATPIFIVGMPRAGSTLVEQILASHSRVEATRELPAMTDVVRDLANSRRILTPNAYPDCVPKLSHDVLASLGERYLREAQPYRRTTRPYFIDKRPWNWLEAGLIHLILPHAKIIDVRREPMAACFAMFKQVLTNGADFTYDLRDLGRYYNAYVGLMDYWQSVMPGFIHFVQYERLVDDNENEIRRMLDYCGLPFEERCLRFWETERAISTPSAEQVRRPIYRDAVEQWRNFEPWLGPLREALSGPARD